MTDKLLIPKNLYEEMLAHCRGAYPNEACGILAGKGDEISKIYKMTNIEKSPVSYFMDSKEQFKAMKDMREAGLAMLAIFHSHPSSPAFPSQKDIGLAFYENCIYVIVGLMEKEPLVSGFLIKDGKTGKVELLVY